MKRDTAACLALLLPSGYKLKDYEKAMGQEFTDFLIDCIDKEIAHKKSMKIENPVQAAAESLAGDLQKIFGDIKLVFDRLGIVVSKPREKKEYVIS